MTWLPVSYLCVVMPDGEPRCERQSAYFRATLAECARLRNPMNEQLAQRAEALRAQVIYIGTICKKGRDL